MDKLASAETLLKCSRNLIASRIGLLVPEQDQALLGKVVAERVRALNLADADEYCQFLASAEDLRHEREELAVLLTTGETYFFRDSGQYALLRDGILPELLERQKALGTLRIWCAACSSGEEAYSLAILLDESMSDRSQWNISILGTDINRQAIAKARQGIYTEWSFRNISDERRQRFFHRHKNTWVLDDAIRERVTFRLGDLVADEFPAPADLHHMDLILCRNTFIYMAPQAVSRIADKFTETLADGGILVTGHGELYAHHLGKLRSRVFPESIVYQKVAAPSVLPTPAPAAEIARPIPTIPAAPTAPAAPSTARPGTAAAPSQPSRRATVETSEESAVAEIPTAWEYANQGLWDKAAASCGELIARNPLSAEPHYLLALLAQEREHFAEAKELLKKTIYLDPSSIAAYLDLGDLYAREGDRPRAGKMRRTARDLLQVLPADGPVRHYGASTANAVKQYVEHLLNPHD
ncbi:MAG: CheR family methyltransferase [Sterolibacterium sp.]|jgi:chemotaxis protein methyltransferase CheR